MRSTNLPVACLVAAGVLAASPAAAEKPVPKTSKQILLVVTPSWDATQGQATAFVHESGVWRKKFGPLPASVGRSGLGRC